MKIAAVMFAAMTIALALPAAAAAETVTVDGRDVYYEVHGDLASGKAPVLLLHGGMMTIESTFGDLIPGLSADRPVIGVEQQGHGHSPINDQDLTLASMRADTLAVLDALGVEHAHVVGFSMGGMLGLELAVNAPGRVASLTAISASQNGDGMLPELIAMNRDPAHKPSPEVAALLPSPADFSAMARDIATKNPGGEAAVQQTMAKTGALIASDWGWRDDQFAAVAVPVMIALGDTDFIRLDHALHMAATIPDAWLAILPETTHMTILARPELWKMIRRRIESVDG